MDTGIWMVAGIIIGAVIAWVIVSQRYNKKHAELEGRASSAEAVAEERGKQGQQKDEEITGLRNELNLARQAKTEASAKLEASQKNLDEQKQLIETMKKDMTDTFNALSAAALKSSSEDFLRLAAEHMGKVIETTKGKLGEHQAAMDGMIKPLQETLKRYEDQINVMEGERKKAYGTLEEQLRTLAATNENLKKETSNLVTALRKPQVRGRWGEMQLKRVAELSGMSGHCDFTEQLSVDTEKGRIRPDMVVHLPMEREIVVDSKVSLEAYLDAISVQTDEEKRVKIERHAQQVRTHMINLSSKEYWNQFDKSPEFVVLFIPGESFLSAALDIDASLIEDGIQRKVIIATPTTFIALLRAIAYGWQQESITKNAQEISKLGKELYERISTMMKHFDDVGSAIKKTTDAYNRTIGSLESRVLPSARRFKELGITGTGEVPALEQIDHTPRSLEEISSDIKDDKV
ncbi:MAG: DNA recombination protein RmuC [Syntrophorhabdaceae bacterium]|nr:DNA recombination protein RmuC [Syntrophorhabdaceae bacterium]MDD5242516.1 DNA recombination protein RmuC [Syntrophorhabdaceae bacterium]